MNVTNMDGSNETERDSFVGGISFFNEGLKHPRATSDAREFIQFDFEELERAMCAAAVDLDGDEMARLAEALRVVLSWIVAPEKLERRKDRRNRFCAMAGRRALALAWVLNPGMFEGGPSAAELSRWIGVHKVMFSEDAANARRKFKIRNRAQAHGKNFKADRLENAERLRRYMKANPMKDERKGMEKYQRRVKRKGK